MRVMLDGRPLQGATGNRGVGRYVRDLLRGLSLAGGDLDLSLLIDPRRSPPDLDGVFGAAPSRGEEPAADRPRGRHPRPRITEATSPPGPAPVWGLWHGPSWLARAELDVWHETFLAPPRVLAGLPWVATIHDLIPLRHPGRFSLRHRLVFRLSLARCARADRVIAVSRFTADQVIETFGVDPRKIVVIPPAIDLGALEGVAAGGITGVDGPYLLHLGGFDPLKGVEDVLLPAFAEVARRHPELRLVMTGGGPGEHRRVDAVCAGWGGAGRVRCVGLLPSSALAGAIAGAAALVVPSHEEGFGIPAVEALAAGVPVVVGQAEATREIVRGVGSLTAGPEPTDFAAAIEAALEQGGPATADAEPRRERARLYSHERVARQVLELYRQVGRGGARARGPRSEPGRRASCSPALADAGSRPLAPGSRGAGAPRRVRPLRRIVIDARVLAHRPTGVARYLRGILDELPSLLEPEERVELWADRPLEARLSEVFSTRILCGPRWGGSDPVWRQLRLAAGVLRDPPSVLFCPFYTVPLAAAVPAVVTIHDVSFAAHPEWFRRRSRLAFRLAGPSARRAVRVLTPSRFSAGEITAYLGVEPSRITVTPLGLDSRWRAGPAAAERAAARDWLGFDGPFVLHLGAVHQRRNVDLLVRGFAALERRPARLVIAGPSIPPAPDLVPLAAELGLEDRLILREWVPEEHLRGLLGEAGALAYLSSYEGFGLPALEAMACGTPVVALRRASLPEVLGGAAVWIEEEAPQAVAEALKEVLDHPSRADELSTLGRRRAAGFTWRRCAGQTLDALRSCYDS